MLSKIVIDAVASFKNPAAISTDKKVNLIYGLNGSGKSTVCKFLQEPSRSEYSQCKTEGGQNCKVLVFNDEFILDNFYESETIKGIFSLSKENKEAEKALAVVVAKRAQILIDQETARVNKENAVARLNKEATDIVEQTFDIKRKYSGGDRVLDFCLEGVMANKERLFERLKLTKKTVDEPKYTAKDLQEEARLLLGDDAGELLLPALNFSAEKVESDPIFNKVIVGSSDSSIGTYIERLRNSDWVKSGVSYLDLDAERPLSCPFCQEPTIDDAFISHLQSYFDRSYEESLSAIKSLKNNYVEAIATLPELSSHQNGKFFDERITQVDRNLKDVLQRNLLIIEKKVANPSEIISLTSSSALIAEFNELATMINNRIQDHNVKIANKAKSRAEIKDKFWTLMRWSYDQNVMHEEKISKDKRAVEDAYTKQAAQLIGLLSEQERAITEAQKSTVNIDESVERINKELINLGVLDFSLKKHDDYLYKLERPGVKSCGFRSLSEGEKMIIALLYFFELSTGNQARDEKPLDRIVVLDDPVSSLSHIYIFNVGRLIMSGFFRSDRIKQVFVFTHSLYFFYELTNPNKVDRDTTQALFRVSKNTSGSTITPMRYEELQNDYQSYWQVVNDRQQPPALLANCMRNILEYFFGFVEKSSFNNVFQKNELSANKFQAFNRYMNRESHSFGQNVFDLKEFDYDVFREGLRAVFSTCGYAEHYKKMSGGV